MPNPGWSSGEGERRLTEKDEERESCCLVAGIHVGEERGSRPARLNGGSGNGVFGVLEEEKEKIAKGF